MLYISRFIGHSLYGVVDTEDNTEEQTGWLGLGTAVSNGVNIKGCIVRDGKLKNAVPYNSEVYQSTQQLKLKSLYGVEFSVWRDYVTGIVWNPENLNKPVPVKLSSLAKKCGSGLLYQMPPSENRNLILVLDEFIEFDMFTFIRYRHSQILNGHTFSVRLDLRLLSDEKVRIIYNSLVRALDDRFCIPDIIIDNPERLNKFMMTFGAVQF